MGRANQWCPACPAPGVAVPRVDIGFGTAALPTTLRCARVTFAMLAGSLIPV